MTVLSTPEVGQGWPVVVVVWLLGGTEFFQQLLTLDRL